MKLIIKLIFNVQSIYNYYKINNCQIGIVLVFQMETYIKTNE